MALDHFSNPRLDIEHARKLIINGIRTEEVLRNLARNATTAFLELASGMPLCFFEYEICRNPDDESTAYLKSGGYRFSQLISNTHPTYQIACVEMERILVENPNAVVLIVSTPESNLTKGNETLNGVMAYLYRRIGDSNKVEAVAIKFSDVSEVVGFFGYIQLDRANILTNQDFSRAVNHYSKIFGGLPLQQIQKTIEDQIFYHLHCPSWERFYEIFMNQIWQEAEKRTASVSENFPTALENLSRLLKVSFEITCTGESDHYGESAKPITNGLIGAYGSTKAVAFKSRGYGLTRDSDPGVMLESTWPGHNFRLFKIMYLSDSQVVSCEKDFGCDSIRTPTSNHEIKLPEPALFDQSQWTSNPTHDIINKADPENKIPSNGDGYETFYCHSGLTSNSLNLELSNGQFANYSSSYHNEAPSSVLMDVSDQKVTFISSSKTSNKGASDDSQTNGDFSANPILSRWHFSTEDINHNITVQGTRGRASRCRVYDYKPFSQPLIQNRALTFRYLDTTPPRIEHLAQPLISIKSQRVDVRGGKSSKPNNPKYRSPYSRFRFLRSQPSNTKSERFCASRTFLRASNSLGVDNTTLVKKIGVIRLVQLTKNRTKGQRVSVLFEHLIYSLFARTISKLKDRLALMVSSRKKVPYGLSKLKLNLILSKLIQTTVRKMVVFLEALKTLKKQKSRILFIRIRKLSRHIRLWQTHPIISIYRQIFFIKLITLVASRLKDLHKMFSKMFSFTPIILSTTRNRQVSSKPFQRFDTANFCKISECRIHKFSSQTSWRNKLLVSLQRLNCHLLVFAFFVWLLNQQKVRNLICSATRYWRRLTRVFKRIKSYRIHRVWLEQNNHKLNNIEDEEELESSELCFSGRLKCSLMYRGIVWRSCKITINSTKKKFKPKQGISPFWPNDPRLHGKIRLLGDYKKNYGHPSRWPRYQLSN
ncbi:MAG: hypothetical protein NZO16_06125 [Deltaproteobacteria bacterium]|nr:hypothetical protein [Deltaproteobacteria bacterium]